MKKHSEFVDLILKEKKSVFSQCFRIMSLCATQERNLSEMIIEHIGYDLYSKTDKNMLPFKTTLYGFTEVQEDQQFSENEIKSIVKPFPEIEVPIHTKFRTGVRLNSKLILNAAVALSPHWIHLYQQKSKGKDFSLCLQIYIGDVTIIAYSQEKLVLVQTINQNLILDAEESLKFAQLLYRNFQLSFPKISEKQMVQVRCEDMSLFPDLDLPLSPSQDFQLTYLSACAKANVKYNHEVVRYIHSLLLSQNTIIDLSQLPFDFKNASTADAISPIFNTLGEIGFLSGICCSNILRPNILLMMAEFVRAGSNFHIVHFENCGITEGFLRLSQVSRSKPNFNVSYWNLRGNNNISDIYYFPEVLSYNTSPLILLDLSNMNIPPKIAAEIFDTLSRHSNLQVIKHLSLAGFPFGDANVQIKVDNFLRTAAAAQTLQIETLDLSQMGSLIDIAFKLFTTQYLPLRILKVNDNPFTYKSIEYVLHIIKTSKSLQEIDVSGTGITPENIMRIIQVISDNENIHAIKLHLNNLNIGNNNLLPVMKTFLTSNREKWRSLSFDSNNLTQEDLKATIAILKRMPKLKEISLSNNFDSSMQNIGETLIDLLKIKSLKKITIRGGDNKRLQKELMPLLTALVDYPSLKKLDISGQFLGNGALSVITSIIRQCTELQEIEIDHNKFNDLDQMDQLVQAIKQNENLITFHYPIRDGKEYVDSKKKHEQDVLIKRISDQQVNSQTFINNNRAGKKMPSELPFVVTEDIAKLIHEISVPEMRKIRGSKLTKHSLACEEMHVPLPFQNEILSEPDDVKVFDGGLMKVYETPSLEKYVEEDRSNYKGIPFTTVNPAFTTLFADDPNMIPFNPEQVQNDVYQNPPLIVDPSFHEDSVHSQHSLHPKQSDSSSAEENKKKRKEKPAPPLKKRVVKDDDSKRKRKINRFQPSSSSSSDEEDTDDFDITTKQITKKDLRRIVDIPDSDSSSSYEEPDILPEERAPKLKRRKLIDDGVDEVPKPKSPVKKNSFKQNQIQKRRIESSSSDSSPPPLPRNSKPTKKSLVISSPSSVSSRSGIEKQEREFYQQKPQNPPTKKKVSKPIHHQMEFSSSSDDNWNPAPLQHPLINAHQNRLSDNSSDDVEIVPNPLFHKPHPMPQNQIKPKPAQRKPLQTKKLSINSSNSDSEEINWHNTPPHVKNYLKQNGKSKKASPSKIPVYQRKFEFSSSESLE